MITGVVAVVAESHDTERRCHGALAGSQYRADQQDLGFPPAGLCTKVRYVAESAHFVLWLAY